MTDEIDISDLEDTSVPDVIVRELLTCRVCEHLNEHARSIGYRYPEHSGEPLLFEISYQCSECDSHNQNTAELK